MIREKFRKEGQISLPDRNRTRKARFFLKEKKTSINQNRINYFLLNCEGG